MKIVFVTGCLQPGKSGVGDYVFDLASECTKLGHPCKVLGINDDFVETQETIRSDVMRPETLRLPSQWPWNRRMDMAHDAIAQWEADWISIQFVCYGYQPRGLIWGLANKLSNLCRGKKAHIMFHELWIGEAAGSTLKHRLVGGLQKWLVLDFIRKLKPKVVQANCSTYIEILRHNGIASERLPLFGSIPIADTNADEFLFAVLQQSGLCISQDNRSGFWLFGMFGSLHPEWKAEPLFSYIRDAANMQQKQCVVISIGRKGHAGERVWHDITRRYSKQFRFLELNEQPAHRVSEVFQSLDFGLAATPVALIGKSASAAAMLEHGLPVIVSRDDFRLRIPFDAEEMSHPLLIPVTPALSQELTRWKRRAAKSNLTSVAKQFLSAIGAETPMHRILAQT